MEVWNSVRLKSQLDQMITHKRTSTEDQVVYVLNPFIASLGYDIYDLEFVDTQIQSGRIIVHPLPHIRIVFSVTNLPPQRDGNVFVFIDTKKAIIQLSMFAMNKWELVDTIDLNKLPDEISATYSSVIRMISLESFQIMYAERADRMFTERILRSKLDKGDMHNDFMVAAVKKLFDAPSDSLLLCLADVLADEFSTDSVNDLHAQLQPLKAQGLRTLVSQYLKEVPMTTDKPVPTVTADKPSPKALTPQEDEVTSIVEKVIEPTDEATPTATPVEDVVDAPKLETENLDKKETIAEKEAQTVVTEKTPEVPRTVGVRAIEDIFGATPLQQRKSPQSKALE